MDATKSGPLEEAVASTAGPEHAGTGTEEALGVIRRAQEGDAAAFEILMRMYEGRVIALGMQMGLSRDDSMDACQETFIKVFRYIARFDTGRSFFKWLYRIAIHAVYDQMRRTRSAPTVSLDDLESDSGPQPADARPSAHARVEADQMARRLRESLVLLSRRERMVFVLRDLQELGTDEIGGILGLSQITVRRHCMSARQKLKNALFPEHG